MALPALLLAAALAGCSGEKPADRRADQDPAVAAALAEQLMTDPDLARINPENRVLAGGGPPSARIPLDDRSPQALARARADAARLVPPAQAVAPPAAAAPLAPARRDSPALAAVAALGPGARACAGKLEPGFAWAARLPAAMPIYPRGHAQQAAGTDRDGCGLRVVNFVSPVPAAELAGFYWAMARRAGLAPDHRLAGADHVIAGRAGRRAGAAIIHAREDGLSEVDLVTSGL
ncbi:hypothetical protein ACFOD9_06015 [Novosphingobium bradum]|uniref:Uncharacterized protein n=1 Tax=Novosphingobium bradum TaxID=1737444 RepID=A0ABV7IUE7_9SPHN